MNLPREERKNTLSIAPKASSTSTARMRFMRTRIRYMLSSTVVISMVTVIARP